MDNEINFLQKARSYAAFMKEVRRDLHRHPELGMQEQRTAQIITKHLQKLNLEVTTGIAGTGVVGTLYGKDRTRTVALRADIDALPMQDKKEAEYASCEQGKAHSCGHDAHTAILMGTASLLAENAEILPGNVKFIFQPNEDTLPGGAKPMVEAGVLDNPRVGAMFSLHVNPLVAEGQVASRGGYASTSSCTFYVTLQGKGGHVAMPLAVNDPVLMAANFVQTIQGLLPKRVDPGNPLILGIGSIHGGSASNIIPDSVELIGSIRTGTPEELDELLQRLQNIAGNVAGVYEGTASVTFQRGYPAVYNDPELINVWQSAAGKVVGTDNVRMLKKIMTTGDDVSYFHNKVPGVYWHLGVYSKEKGFVYPLHSPHFDFDEDAVLPIGAAVQAQSVFHYFGVAQ